MHHVVLIPGFFGFNALAGVSYFSHVSAVLAEAFADRDLEVAVEVFSTLPTSSLEQRARRLAHFVTSRPPGPVHLVGHSTGGLDARLLASVAPELGDGPWTDARQRVRSVLTVATPHRGAPLAEYFEERAGAELLKLLALLAVRVTELTPVSPVTAQLLRLIVDPDAPDPPDGLQRVKERLYSGIAPAARPAIAEYLAEIHRDQSLLPELRPARLAARAATWRLSRDMPHGCIVTQARRPGIAAVAELGLSPARQALHFVFRWLQGRAAQPHHPVLTSLQSDELIRRFGSMAPNANDGIVPTRSQVWGPVVDVAWADHLDVVGHFHGPEDRPPRYDWLPSASRFGRVEFERVWNKAAAFIAGGCSPS